MKWMPTPSMSVVNCGSAFSLASQRRQSYSVAPVAGELLDPRQLTPCDRSATSAPPKVTYGLFRNVNLERAGLGCGLDCAATRQGSRSLPGKLRFGQRFPSGSHAPLKTMAGAGGRRRAMCGRFSPSELTGDRRLGEHAVAELVGRRGECEALDRLMADVLAGTSRVLVLRGDAGAGKSALLGYLSGQMAGWRVVSAVGVESEMELAFSGLHRLCAPLLDHLDDLPPPQHDALATVFGLSAGPAPDRFLVGLATLTLVAQAAD